jgi:hypothetical protein
MVMRTVALVAVVAACFFGGGCSNYSCADMGFKSFERADRIVVKQMSKDTLTTITVPSRISQIARFVEAHESGWSVPFGGTPVGSISMEFYSGAKFLGDFGIGRGFVQAQGCGYFFSRDLTADDRREISRLLGISDDVLQ